ncbi:MAG: macro domain-containing protein [Erysipelotrichaceae bacterium]|nr:macro domain-containing protein [Erysipelotrichaceae bacterium]
MPFKVIRDSIVNVKADAIVNSANPYPTYGRGIDEKIYLAAGKEELLKEREKIGVIKRGKAAYTKAFNLNARYIIHTVGPQWRGGSDNEISLLASCLQESLKLALELKCESIAFPLISTGIYGFPKQLAIKTFTAVIFDFLMNNEMDITLVVYDDESFDISSKIFGRVENHFKAPDAMFMMVTGGFQKAINVKETSFHDYLLQLIVESDLTNPAIYNGANITKQHFSKIISNRDYTPTKNTICALGLSMHLDLEQLELLLKKAGYSLTDSKAFDLAVKYFIRNRMYNIVEDNLMLFENGIEQIGTIK